MQIAQMEQRPVIYSAGAIKLRRFCPYKDKICFPLHWHERIEILYIREGEIEYVCANKKGLAKTGDVVIFPPKTAHYGKALTQSVYDVLMFDVRYFYNETDICKKYLPAIFEGRVVFETNTRDMDIIDCVKSICDKTNPDSFETVAKIYTLLNLFINKEIVKISECTTDNKVRFITDYIEQNIDSDLSTDFLCEHFGYSEGHFCRIFKKSTGLSPISYIKICRLEKAYKMIKQNEGSIFEIASKCGFSDSNYFTRCFKKHYGFPPSKIGDNI